MSKLPGAQELAILVSNVTGAMFGAHFFAADRMLRGESICDQMAMIHIAADPGLTIVSSLDAQAGRTLSAIFLGRPDGEISPTMIDEVTARLLKAVAARLSRILDIEQPVGVPERTTLGDLVRKHGTLDFDDAILLQCQGDLDISLWILEERSEGTAHPRSSSANGGLLRFLMRTIGPRKGGRAGRRSSNGFARLSISGSRPSSDTKWAATGPRSSAQPEATSLS